MIEKELRANWDSLFYPQPDDAPEGQTFGEEVEPVEPPVLLAQAPTEGGGAAFGVFPQMKPRRAGASEAGGSLALLGADVAAGAGKGLVSGSVGLAGDVLALGRGIYEIGRRGGDESKLDAFLRGMEKGFILPTSDDVDKWLTENIGPVVPAGSALQAEREAAAGAGRLVGEVVADPFVAIKAAKTAVKGAKALAPKAGEMLSDYMQRTGLQQNLMAYHGTPHTVDKFDSKKIGTGEGAQAYGYGLYFAESPGVAKGYAMQLSTPSGPVGDVAKYWRNNGGEQAFRAYATDAGLKTKEIEEVVSAIKSKGNVYTVDIPDATVGKMLDFDAPLSQQSREIQALAKQYKLSMDDLGGDLLAAAGGKTAKGAQAMRAAGIPGVRYLDQGSRGDGKGTRNLVVFPGGENQIKILKVNDNKVIMPQPSQEPK